MPEMIHEVLHNFTDLYSRGEYGRALKLLEREYPRCPGYHMLLLFWQACMAARIGDTETAIARLQSGVAGGGWYHEAGMRGDPDLESLQADSRFADLVHICAERRARTKEFIQPERLVIEPQGIARPWPVLFALHGNMSNMSLFAPYWKRAADLGWLVVIPQSTQLFWASDFYVWDDHQRALGELQEHYLAVSAEYEFDPRQLVVAGFSSGGGTAARAALSGALPAGGFILFEGYSTAYEKRAEWLDMINQSSTRLRACVQSGQLSADMVDGAQELRDMLAWRGIPTRLYPTANTSHQMPPNFDSLLEEMLTFLSKPS